MDTRRNLKYSRAFPYVGAQRLGMLRPSQREPTQESALREYAILHRTPNSGAPRPSLAVSILFLATALSTIPADAAELMIGGGGLSGIKRTGHSWLHTDADAARGGHRHADAGATWGGHRHADVGATWGGHRHADVGATWGDQRRPLYLTRQSNQSNQSDSLSVPTLDSDCLGRPEARQ